MKNIVINFLSFILLLGSFAIAYADSGAKYTLEQENRISGEYESVIDVYGYADNGEICNSLIKTLLAKSGDVKPSFHCKKKENWYDGEIIKGIVFGILAFVLWLFLTFALPTGGIRDKIWFLYSLIILPLLYYFAGIYAVAVFITPIILFILIALIF